MTITSVGYGGTVTEDKIAGWRRSFPATYGVVGAGDWAVTLKTGVDRTVGVAAGTAFGHAVTDVNTAEITKQLDTLASGSRYDLVVARRNWVGAGGTTTLDFVTGTSSQTAVFASRNQTPGTLDDQPLALVKVTGNGAGGVISQIIDLRVWAANGGAVAALNATGLDGTPLVLQYLNEVGTEVWVGSDLWHRYVDVTGSAQWQRTASASVPVLATGFGITGTPGASADFKIQAGTLVRTTDANAYVTHAFTVPFPNGLLSIVITPADDNANPNITANLVGGDRSSFSYRVWVGYPGLAFGINYLHRVNYIAIGW